MSRIVLYGIKNCDTCRKARKWLDEQGIEHDFHDFRQDGAPPDLMETLIARLGREALLNKRGTTWRKLDERDKKIADDAAAAKLFSAHPALVKRPVWRIDGGYDLGFGEEMREKLAARPG